MSIRFLGFSYCTFFSNLSSLLFSTLFVIFNIPILVLLMLPIPKVNELDALLACLFFVLIIVFTPICYKHIYPSFLSFPVNARNLGLNASNSIGKNIIQFKVEQSTSIVYIELIK